MNQHVQTHSTVEKAIDVLFHLHASPGAQGVTAIGRALGFPKSSAHRLLASLSHRGLVERDDRGRYRPGVALVALGLGVLDAEPVVLAARPALEAGVRDLGETFFLVAVRAGELIVLDKVEGTGFLRASPRVGSSVPVHATAVGKLWLAFDSGALPPPEGCLVSYTPRTCTHAKALSREVHRARERGFAQSCEEWIPGLSVVAAPVIISGRLRAAVAVAVPSPQLTALGVDALAEGALRAASCAADRLAGCSRSADAAPLPVRVATGEES